MSSSGATRRWLALATGLLAATGCRSPDEAARPDVVLIVVDTLRADHLSSYGYERATSPAIDRLLAERGVLFERAYSQAPWTAPSVASYLSGLWPRQLVERGGGLTIPAGVPTLAERFRAAGYRTAGFFANPTLSVEEGFRRGHDHFWTVPLEIESMRLGCRDGIQDEALRWLREAVAEGEDRPPLFATVHYIDPHDPYQSPELRNGRSPFFPDYDGALRGDDVHALFLGRKSAERPADVEHVEALYDSEIAHVDACVGELVEAVAALSSNVLFAFTSDHGEELFDHGGWKHGRTLYDEQIRVPLILRWDGRLPAGGRVPRTVRLVDLAPTLLEAAVIDPAAMHEAPALDGRSLLGLAEPTAVADRRVAFAQNFSAGPVRVAAVSEGVKLVHFDAEAPFDPADERERRAWLEDLARLEPIELYDLAADPGEQRNLWPDERDGVDRGLLGVLRRALRDLTSPRATDALDDQTRERLQALGYLQ